MSETYHRLSYNLMMLPGVALLVVFCVVPLAGSSLAFQSFLAGRGFFGSPWVGLANFRLIFELPDARQVILNTLVISLLKAAVHFPVQIGFAIALKEVTSLRIKKVVQTSVYLPHFISWVILGEVIRYMLSQDGIFNGILAFMHIRPIYFLGTDSIFRYVVVGSDLWKEFGFSAIIYMAALAGISPVLYEACFIDGGNKWHEIRFITLPGLKSVIVLSLVLGLGNILNTGFDQIYNLYNPLVYHSGDVLDTFVYRAGILNAQYSFATAVGLFKSVISFALVLGSYLWAYKYANYRIF